MYYTGSAVRKNIAISSQMTEISTTVNKSSVSEMSQYDNTR